MCMEHKDPIFLLGLMVLYGIGVAVFIAVGVALQELL